MVTHFNKSKKKTSSQPIFFYTVLGIIILIIVGFLVISNLKINKKRNELLAQINYLEKEIQTLEEKKQKLEAGVLEQGTQDYLEKEAREKLGLKKPGEEVVVVLPPKETSEGKTQKNKTFWQKILEILHLRD